MPRRFFRKFALKSDTMRQQWYLGPFSHLLHDPNLWSIRRRTIVPAFSLGLFVAYLPIPGHMITAALVALALRINIPVATASTWVINPLVIGPAYYLAYEFGSFLLRREPRPFEFELSFAWLIDGFVYVWEPLLLGCVLLGAILSLLGYVALDLLWRASIADYLSQRQHRRKIKE
jgi:uncharacterized protein (DUF2062 family)